MEKITGKNKVSENVRGKLGSQDAKNGGGPNQRKKRPVGGV